jgi:magnesium chelatase family protein
MSRIGTALGIALNGLEGTVVEIEVDIAPGLPNLTIVGLADTAIEQSKHRVRAALQNSGLQFPDSRVVGEHGFGECWVLLSPNRA